LENPIKNHQKMKKKSCKIIAKMMKNHQIDDFSSNFIKNHQFRNKISIPATNGLN